MRPGDNKGLSLFSRMLIAFLTVVILVSGALTWAFYVFSRRSIEQRTAESILQQFKAIEYQFVFESREDMVKDLRILASNPVLDDFIMSSAAEREIGARVVERLFLGAMKFHESYESVSFVDIFGREQVRVDRSGRIRTYRNMSANRLFTRIQAVSPGGVEIVGPWKDSAGRIVASIGIHKVDQDIGKFGGALIIDWGFDSFIDHLDGIRVFNENLIWLFSRDGALLKQPSTTGEALDPRPYLSKDVQSTPRLSMVKEGMVVYQDLSVLPGKPLVRLAIGVPSSLLLTDVRTTLKFFLLVLLLAVLITSIITYNLSRYLSKPITALAEAAARLATGDLSTQVATRTTGEIRLLVDSFNRMASDLDKTTVSKEYVDSIIHSMADTLIVVNLDGTIKTVNAALIRLLGSEEELVGKPIASVLAGGAVEADALVGAISKDGGVSSVETHYVFRAGSRIPVLVSGATIRDKNGVSRGFVLIGKDITDRKTAEDRLRRYADELRESNSEIQSFSYIISHDLRAPLVSIKGFSSELAYTWKDIEAILGKYLPGMDEKDRRRLDQLVRQDIREALTFIASSADRMDSLINSILTLSRVGRRELLPERIDLEVVVREIIDSLAHQIGEKKVRVAINDLPAIITDRLAMEQIMGNLIDNAVKYLDAGRPGELNLTADAQGDETVFHVSDNGQGIAADDIPKVFEIFKRVGKQDVPGEGMGLATVKMLVKRLGGRIWCESELGKGSTFSFTVPLPSDPPQGGNER